LGNRFCDELQSRRAGGCIEVPAPPSRGNISAREIHLGLLIHGRGVGVNPQAAAGSVLI
jgi:hypothetical protein